MVGMVIEMMIILGIIDELFGKKVIGIVVKL